MNRLSGFSGLPSLLWPIRYKPQPDELLSSWLVRLSVGHGLRVQTFCNLIFGNQRQVWNRDIDRLAPDWLINELSLRTGTPIEIAQVTTLRAYEGQLYQRFRTAGTLPWIQTLRMYHRKRVGFGQQYCAACLAGDDSPYFRRAWRVSFNTVCPRHKLMLRDRCPACQTGVSYHRMEMGRSLNADALELANCHECGFDLRESAQGQISAYSSDIRRWIIDLSRVVTHGTNPKRLHIDLDQLRVMHQLTMLLLSKNKYVRLLEYLRDCLKVQDNAISKDDRVSIETRNIDERHQVIQLVGWLMLDLEPRLRAAWRNKSIRYNSLLKDFRDSPAWFIEIAEGFSNWRNEVIVPLINQG